eukprot:CAMPEP_0194541238 /NCGR_PEP_ID=MMETSP0253-20130528/81888_1 /TAXON_ID=2966 /ORGANISM="Noctiluca scintillans" /LENGTH=154 /DNA_ID=CAMNT_0039387707 /DNA_START=12 /DNA_END=476 /DNA_ORIENTATION=-
MRPSELSCKGSAFADKSSLQSSASCACAACIRPVSLSAPADAFASAFASSSIPTTSNRLTPDWATAVDSMTSSMATCTARISGVSPAGPLMLTSEAAVNTLVRAPLEARPWCHKVSTCGSPATISVPSFDRLVRIRLSSTALTESMPFGGSLGP